MNFVEKNPIVSLSYSTSHRDNFLVGSFLANIIYKKLIFIIGILLDMLIMIDMILLKKYSIVC